MYKYVLNAELFLIAELDSLFQLDDLEVVVITLFIDLFQLDGVVLALLDFGLS